MISDWGAFFAGIVIATIIAYSPIIHLSWSIPGILFDSNSRFYEKFLKILGGVPYWGLYVLFCGWALEQELITALVVLILLHHVHILSMIKN